MSVAARRRVDAVSVCVHAAAKGSLDSSLRSSSPRLHHTSSAPSASAARHDVPHRHHHQVLIPRLDAHNMLRLEAVREREARHGVRVVLAHQDDEGDAAAPAPVPAPFPSPSSPLPRRRRRSGEGGCDERQRPVNHPSPILPARPGGHDRVVGQPPEGRRGRGRGRGRRRRGGGGRGGGVRAGRRRPFAPFPARQRGSRDLIIRRRNVRRVEENHVKEAPRAAPRVIAAAVAARRRRPDPTPDAPHRRQQVSAHAVHAPAASRLVRLRCSQGERARARVDVEGDAEGRGRRGGRGGGGGGGCGEGGEGGEEVRSGDAAPGAAGKQCGTGSGCGEGKGCLRRVGAPSRWWAIQGGEGRSSFSPLLSHSPNLPDEDGRARRQKQVLARGDGVAEQDGVLARLVDVLVLLRGEGEVCMRAGKSTSSTHVRAPPLVRVRRARSCPRTV
jgi:hypothetical protein